MSNLADLERAFEEGRRLVDSAPAAAAQRFLAILEHRPDAVAAWLMLGVALRAAGQMEGALEAYQQGLRHDPNSVEILVNLAQLYALAKHPGPAEALYRRVLSLRHESLAVRGLVQLLVKRNAWAEAERVYVEHPPRSVAEQWDQLRILPIIYSDAATSNVVRKRYADRLAALDTAVGPPQAAPAWEAAQDAFHLHYLEGSHRAEQQTFGRLLSRLATVMVPVRPPVRPLEHEKIRVGFCSSMLCEHTVSRLFGGWIEQMDRRRFEVFSYHLGPVADSVTRRLEARCDRFRHLPRQPTAAVAARIQEDGVHALIFPELGMDVTSLKVAACRLAALQLCTWGHPVTTGLPTVDVFLSSEWMEPEGGEANYTESLVRLPNLGLFVEPPAVAVPPLSRADFGLPEGAPLLLTTQSLFKLLPQYDGAYVDLLEATPGSVLVFLSHASAGVTDAFCQRFSSALRARGVDPDSRVRLLPNQSWDRFLALNALCDVFLDALGWSGGMTTLDALSQGLVPVTRPGPQMRQRHTAAILKRLAVEETIVPDVAGWVLAAARVATDRPWRDELRARIRANLPKLYADPAPVRALEGLLTSRLGG